MPQYMVQFRYSPETWNALLRKPEDRTSAVDALAKSFGGRVVALYYHSGKYDGTVVVEAPDDSTANALVFAVAATGTLSESRTTRLFSPEEFVDSLRRAGKGTYRPPGKS
jgi:uncharacterized protein with GYD domain